MDARCPCCQSDIEAVEPEKDGQVTCPECGSWFPRAWAGKLADFEAERDRRIRLRKEETT